MIPTYFNLFSDIVSLGSSCQTAYQLKRLQLRKSSGPLDWFITSNTDGLIKLVQNEFQNFMEMEHLQVLGQAHQHYVVRDNFYQVISYHDFPITNPGSLWNQEYSRYKIQVDRRVQRFLDTLTRSTSLLLVRTQTTKEEAVHLRNALHPWVKTSNYLLLIVNYHTDENRTDVVRNNWSLYQIQALTIPKGTDWRGSDAAWSEIFS
ncbi:Putative papain-like cysteine peptidase [Paenibacillus sp. yr247]|uniref:DUF1796 family putative cysteine peptidase n=1 Tax=Paenibacillus sp. yr247 TaxID=1761880 RepID=UPI000882A627|nr:DUF1796 family putative cysteine peptidase [Paenibacillus sp. yr247]SDO21695.1 Putative papain-like cysteine peptidase [Paenibacillus sp. yr247]